MKSKAKLIKALHDDLQASVAAHVARGAWHENLGNADTGATALRRKIIYLRRELLNLKKELDREIPWYKE